MRIAAVVLVASVLALPGMAQVNYYCADKPDGTPCDDGNACTVGDTCYGGYCIAGPLRNCNDGNPCTIDSCVAYSGCVHQVDPSCANQPPNCAAAIASPSYLWPPHRQMMPVSVRGVADPDRDRVTITITGISQDEPVVDSGDGTCSDAEAAGPNLAFLRAERSENGDGRVYHITFTAIDPNGGRCTGTVQVCVPLRRGQGCQDSGFAINWGVCLAE